MNHCGIERPVVIEKRFQRPVKKGHHQKQVTDDQRRVSYERALNEQAREGWEVIGSVLNRDTVQTIGGAVTTRDSTSFVAYRRPRK